MGTVPRTDDQPSRQKTEDKTLKLAKELKANKMTVKATTDDDVEEECWGLPSDFDLFTKHEIQEVYYPATDDASTPHSFRIECIEPDTPLDINNKSTSSSEYDATGHCVWAGALLLTRCIHELERFDVRGKRVIEFGCGTGVGGLAMMLANSSSVVPSYLCFTDNDPDALKVCARNCKLNNLPDESYSIRELTWGEATADDADVELFDIALATDVLYDVDLIDPLFTTISTCIPPKSLFILSHIPRACYNEGNPPEAVKDLEKYIIDQGLKYNLHLIETIRPPEASELEIEREKGFIWATTTSFMGGGILIFQLS